MDKDHDLMTSEDLIRLLAAALREATADELGRKTWLSVAEAARYLGRSEDYIRDKIRGGYLHCGGERRAYLIYRAHLDEQVARCWPRLEVETAADILSRVLKAKAPAEVMPRPLPVKRPGDGPSCPPLDIKAIQAEVDGRAINN